ncbi:hypothetical protein B0A49_03998 [Cryomyces minteri]|uniref:Twinfilin n=2 Tax=Cryomyces minteri TaxID=331657 RepID=A0A4U0WYK0_9PEZI|nr:hypothetical protein B0A49_03998 [Cryomyces minteri]
MQSGITASQELLSAFQTLVSSPSQRGLLATISAEQLVPSQPIPSTSPDFLADLSTLPALLTPTAAAYILLRYSAAPDGFVAVTYVPDAAPVRQKMLFAATRLTLVRELGIERFRETVFATTTEELTADGWRRHERHVGEKAPLTEEERALEGVKEAEAEESRGTATRRGHVSSGVSFPVREDAVEALRALVAGSGEDGENLVQLKIDVSTETITLVSHTSTSASSLSSAISDTEPRYSFFRYSPPSHTSTASSSPPIIFIYTCPTGSKVKERMVYAASRAFVIQVASTEAGVEVAKKMEATSPEEITAEMIEDEFRPKEEAKSGFSRPKRPGRR